MHHIIKDILDNDCSIESKKSQIAELKESIKLAEQIFSGKFAYCKKCGDYYLSKSFIVETKIVTERVCTYSDPINSGGDEYENKDIRYTYKYCPKGCKHIINREEYWV